MQMEDTTTLNLLRANSHLISYIPQLKAMSQKTKSSFEQTNTSAVFKGLSPPPNKSLKLIQKFNSAEDNILIKDLKKDEQSPRSISQETIHKAMP